MTNENTIRKPKPLAGQTIQNDTSISSHNNGTTESFAGESFTTSSRSEKTFPKSDSITGVNPSRSHGVGVWGNRRIVVGIRVDEGLYSAFKPIAQGVFGSVCSPIEAFMASIVAAHGEGVNFGKTIEIGKIVIERNLRARRRLVVEEEVEVVDRKPNFYDSRFGVWEHRDVDLSQLNEHGHVVGCGCMLCRGS